jgi:hypothetical protein
LLSTLNSYAYAAVAGAGKGPDLAARQRGNEGYDNVTRSEGAFQALKAAHRMSASAPAMPELEQVLTVWNYYDRPRSGIAMFRGVPHYYECVFDDRTDEWSDYYFLRPLEPNTVQLAMEKLEIWERWNEARRQGRVSLDSGPALPEDKERYSELSESIQPKLTIDPTSAIVVQGDFEGRAGWWREFRVRWTEIDRGLLGRVARVGSVFRSS